MNKKIIISIPFNINLGLYSKDTPGIKAKFAQTFPKTQKWEWIDHRMALFMQYTASSLLHQTDPSFLCLIRHTYETTPLIQRALQMYPQLPRNILFTPFADQIIYNEMQQTDMLYHITLDSDNMLSPFFIASLDHYRPLSSTQSLICQYGYLLDHDTKQAATLYHPSPSFYAAVYTQNTFDLYYPARLFESHWLAVYYPYEVLPGQHFCIVTHADNLDNDFNSICQTFNAHILTAAERTAFFNQWSITGGAAR